MAASSTQAPVMVQTNTYNMNTNHQDRPCMHRCYPCAVCLIVISLLILGMGAANIAIASARSKNLSDSFYESFPELKKSAQRQLYAGIGIVICGALMMIICIVWCCYIKRSTSTQSMYSGSAMLSTVVVPPIASSSQMVKPPRSQGGSQPTHVYSYQPAHPGSIPHASNQYRPVQSSNQYPPTQSGNNQYAPVQPTSKQYPPVQSITDENRHVRAPSSAAYEGSPDSPPPSYNELMRLEKKSTPVYGKKSTLV